MAGKRTGQRNDGELYDTGLKLETRNSKLGFETGSWGTKDSSSFEYQISNNKGETEYEKNTHCG